MEYSHSSPTHMSSSNAGFNLIFSKAACDPHIYLAAESYFDRSAP